MARKPKARDDHPVDEPIELEEPVSPGGEAAAEAADQPWANRNIWLRGAFALILGVLFSFAVPILGVLAVVQFFWLLFTGEKNEPVAEFGAQLAGWMGEVALFGTGASDAKPFPWKEAG